MLGDKDLMDFGMHKGKEIQDVPASWLFWYYNNVKDKENKTKREKDMLEYIDDNLEVLKKELRESQK